LILHLDTYFHTDNNTVLSHAIGSAFALLYAFTAFKDLNNRCDMSSFIRSLGSAQEVSDKVFGALRCCGLMSDHDHSMMADKPITYLLPSVTQQAHFLSKDVGRYIDSSTGQWIMARYRALLNK
jgi:hypothetical protein